jgi:hypothetical protein
MKSNILIANIISLGLIINLDKNIDGLLFSYLISKCLILLISANSVLIDMNIPEL